jgi:hypothetical protein
VPVWCMHCHGNTYGYLVELDAVDVGSPGGDEEDEGPEDVGAPAGLEQAEREVGHCSGGLSACQCRCTIEGGLQGAMRVCWRVEGRELALRIPYGAISSDIAAAPRVSPSRQVLSLGARAALCSSQEAVEQWTDPALSAAN